jgi:diaminohydroxyphosphoribosylaminopyrimidine deaminase/5-amino-6-(5-phosphoribosylamino)uracil reductase
MSRAVELSLNGPAHNANPRVGCVVLDAHGAIIAEGWHRGAGTPHAEIDALSQLSPSQVRGSTFVVTLEPCNHTGRTGPCADALVTAGVARVVFGLSDPGDVEGGGGDKLRAAGIEVISGVGADEVMTVVRDWYDSAALGRAVVTIKWASSLDGRAAANDGTSQWISGEAARERVHQQRSEHDAIAVGTSTVIADNPSLTARTPDGELYTHQPIPVVIGEREVTGERLNSHPRDTIYLRTRDLRGALVELRERGIHSLYVEGGPTLASAFIEAGLADRFYIFLAPVLLGGQKLAVTDIGVSTLTERVDLTVNSTEFLGDDILISAWPTGAPTQPHRKEA